jgi:transcriptional regulator with XRE-family HTH domain
MTDTSVSQPPPTSPTPNPDVLVARMYQLRLDEDLSWDQVARLFGLNRSTVMQWCEGKVHKYWDRKIVRLERFFALDDTARAEAIAAVKKSKAAAAAA